MKVHRMSAAPTPELAAALSRFDGEFQYPLGPERFFRIDHGDDYPRFFRAMGDGVCFAAEREGRILGVAGAAVRAIVSPDGQERSAAYIGDVKVASAARGGRVFPRLAAAVREWVGSRAAAAFAVVMDGTPVVPTRYTGRLDIPPFVELDRVVVLRVLVSSAAAIHDDCWTTNETLGGDCYRRLSAGKYACPGGDPAERSETPPLWVVEPSGQACGRLEDTRRAKRLIADDGCEMRSAHLSCFAYHSAAAGIELLRIALRHAAHRGFPALFTAVSRDDVEQFAHAFDRSDTVFAQATVFGAGFNSGPSWNINTAEI